MSRKWKIAIGVGIAIVVAGVALAVWGVVTFGLRAYEHGWTPTAHEWVPDEATIQLEVRLVDDDGDGIPDRGVIEMPEDLQHDRGCGLSILRRGSRGAMFRGGPHLGHGFGPHSGRGPVLSLSKGFGPFLIVGGLFRLAFLALLIGLAVAFFRHWNRAKEARESQRG